jgi:hypothetical protein
MKSVKERPARDSKVVDASAKDIGPAAALVWLVRNVRRAEQRDQELVEIFDRLMKGDDKSSPPRRSFFQQPVGRMLRGLRRLFGARS